MEFLKSLVYWHWLIFALLLFILEIAAPGAFFIWMAIAAGVVGMFVWMLDIGWGLQYLLFSLLSIASIVGWKAYKARYPDTDVYPGLNQRGHSLVGRQFTLIEPIVNQSGKVNVDDSRWKVRGPDLPKGSNVRVTAVDGTVLIVEQAD